MSLNRSKLFVAVIFIGIGTLTRTVFHLAPNVEFITSIALLSGYYLRGRYKFMVPFITMVITDTIIGNTSILIFTWSAYILGGYFGEMLIVKSAAKPGFDFWRRLARVELGGIAFTLFFYLWTNLGVWVLGPWYPKTIAGLLQCYINAIPFLRPQLLGNLIIIPAMVTLSEFLLNYLPSKIPTYAVISRYRK